MKNILDRLFFQSYLQEDEEVLYIVHRHFIPICIHFFVLLSLFILLPTAIYILFELPQPYEMYGYIFLLFYGVFALFYAFVDWYCDALVLTNKNLLHLSWHGLFNRESMRVKYHDIESVDVHVNGFLQTLFHYGNLEIKTANEHMHAVLVDARNVSLSQASIITMTENIVQHQKEGGHEATLADFKTALHHFVDEYFEKSSSEKKKIRRMKRRR